MDAFISECLKDIKGTIVGIYYGETSTGQKYLIVINKRVWYALRIFFDIGYANKKPCQIYREGFFKCENAKIVKLLNHCGELANSKSPRDFYKFIAYLKAVYLSSFTISEYLSFDELLRARKILSTIHFHPINGNAYSLFLHSRDFQLPNDVKTNPSNYLTPGDYVMILRKLVSYNHHAIYAGKGEDGKDKVIHIFNEEKKDIQENKKKDSPIDHLIQVKREAYVRMDDWSRFYGDKETKCYKRCFLFKHKTNEEILKTAIEEMYENTRKGKYNLLKENCRHFATYCATDYHLPDEFTSRVIFKF
jgi:hypothetical protein